MYNLEKEREQLFENAGPQVRRLRPGYTREQAKRFYDRETAVLAARATRIKTDNGPDIIMLAIDRVVAAGHTEIREVGRWISLWHPRKSVGYQYGDKVSRDYINVVFNRGNMTRNY